MIMAGGKGTRIASVNSAVPKPMLTVAGKPVLQHQIECLRRQGFTDIVLTIGHLGKQIEDFFGDGTRLGVSISYIRETAPLGTAGALYYLKGQTKEDFLLLNGDLIFDVDLHRLAAFHKQRGAQATLLAHPNDHPYDSGLLQTDENDRVQGWLTKEDKREWCQNCVNAGIHVLSPKVLDRIPAAQKTDLDRDILKPLLASGMVYAYRTPEYVKDMGTPERIREVEHDLRVGLVRQKNLSQKQRAVFLDRDGTINRYEGFLRDIEQFELLPEAAKAIRRINQSGYLAIVVTNQPVIARGEVTWEELRRIHCKMETLLGQEGAYLDDIFICPHHPDKGFAGERPEYKIDCSCRKPKPGLLLQAAEKYNIDLAGSWMIGDSERDVQAGLAAGCRAEQIGADVSLADVVDRLLGGEKSGTA